MAAPLVRIFSKVRLNTIVPVNNICLVSALIFKMLSSVWIPYPWTTSHNPTGSYDDVDVVSILLMLSWNTDEYHWNNSSTSYSWWIMADMAVLHSCSKLALISVHIYTFKTLLSVLVSVVQTDLSTMGCMSGWMEEQVYPSCHRNIHRPGGCLLSSPSNLFRGGEHDEGSRWAGHLLDTGYADADSWRQTFP